MTDATRDEICVVAVAECFRGDGERLCNPIGTIPMVGGRLARESFEPDLVMTDGFALLVANPMPVGIDDAEKVVEAWNPYRTMFDVVMMVSDAVRQKHTRYAGGNRLFGAASGDVSLTEQFPRQGVRA